MTSKNNLTKNEEIKKLWEFLRLEKRRRAMEVRLLMINKRKHGQFWIDTEGRIWRKVFKRYTELFPDIYGKSFEWYINK